MKNQELSNICADNINHFNERRYKNLCNQESESLTDITQGREDTLTDTKPHALFYMNCNL